MIEIHTRQGWGTGVFRVFIVAMLALALSVAVVPAAAGSVLSDRRNAAAAQYGVVVPPDLPPVVVVPPTTGSGEPTPPPPLTAASAAVTPPPPAAKTPPRTVKTSGAVKVPVAKRKLAQAARQPRTLRTPELPFTGYAALALLLTGIVLFAGGLALRSVPTRAHHV